jgi:hypothetical protein
MNSLSRGLIFSTNAVVFGIGIVLSIMFVSPIPFVGLCLLSLLLLGEQGSVDLIDATERWLTQ